MVGEYQNRKDTISPAKVNKMRERFTAKHFDEGLNDALGVVTRLMKEANYKDEARQNAIDLYGYIQRNRSALSFNGVSKDDPANPHAQDPAKWEGREGPIAFNNAMAGYLAMRSNDDEVFNRLTRLGDDMAHGYIKDPKIIKGVKNILDYLYKNATIGEASVETGTSIEHQAVESLEESFENFIPKF